MGVLDTDDPLYDAFRRYDQYGILGWEIQPWAERARLFLMAISLVPLKFLGCVYFVGCFYLICRCVLTACFRPAVMYLTAFCKREASCIVKTVLIEHLVSQPIVPEQRGR